MLASNIKINVNAILTMLNANKDNEIERNKCKNSLSYFTQKAFNIIDNANYIHNWHIDLLCDYLQDCYYGKIKRSIRNFS